MKLSIIILNYKQLGMVKNCLKSINKLSLPFEFETIVVDNNSNDESVKYLKENYFNIKLIESGKNLGFSGGNNLGINVSVGEYALVINPDIILNNEALISLVKYMDENENVGMSGPKLLNPDGSLQYSCSRFPDWKLPFFRRSFLRNSVAGKEWNNDYFMKDWDHESNKKVDWLFGACILVRKNILDKVGLLDDRFFMYVEDLDWSRRFWQNGYEVWYIAEAKVIHYHHRDSAEGVGIFGLFKKSGRVHLVSWLKYYFKYKGKLT
ncbi:glycosyltransferase family 2 protein [bacterium]|jgi:N-acetylglucosaminyl-diphospho-decaprenol L-rhamnosyltransferase|nr:glycosyltransferase family 2 protein [bacterium]MBT4122281.1 glycosyltransferase family 2 protein [bacterium]MBT4335359.1 glycosyltransferase family 2 protein [bacterium]MBT4495752.1 glycosyltransferase family 2 protein [bacterium]MBT4764136.1 glycosyltransferase family 2 protein [bacterium]